MNPTVEIKLPYLLGRVKKDLNNPVAVIRLKRKNQQDIVVDINQSGPADTFRISTHPCPASIVNPPASQYFVGIEFHNSWDWRSKDIDNRAKDAKSEIRSVLRDLGRGRKPVPVATVRETERVLARVQYAFRILDAYWKDLCLMGG